MIEAVEAISTSKEIYYPSEEVIANANVPNYLEIRQQACEDPVSFWDARAREMIEWYEPYQVVCRRQDEHRTQRA
jgi:acetyl-CoA synthetase